jgi:predicted transcriptional regulator
MSRKVFRVEETRNRLLQDKHEQIVAIVKANPGISIGQIRKQLTSPDGSGNLAAAMVQLCADKRIEYRDVNCYLPVED